MMRHTGTLIAAVVVAPLAWALLALGHDRSSAAFASADNGGALHANDFVRPLLLLAAAGLLLGLLGTLRFSPLGAMVIGVVFTVSSTLLLVAPADVVDLFTTDLSVAGQHIDLAAPVRAGTTMVLGVLLLVGAISVQRWRRWPKPAGPASESGPREHALGMDGLGLTSPPYRTPEPAPTNRYVMDPEPYDDAQWPPPDESTTRRATSAGNAPYGW